MKKIFFRSLYLIMRPLVFIIYKKKLPHFSEDFKCNRVFMISELPGGEGRWIGQKRRHANLGNTHSWNRYFNKSLQTKPVTLADIEYFLIRCKYLSDQITRSQADFWEPPDIFEKRKTGDCEDHAIWAWRHLHDMGYKTRFVLGKTDGWHAWVHIFVNGRAYLLEATQKYRWFPDIADYDAYWSVERIGKKKFAFYLHQDKDKSIGEPEFQYKGFPVDIQKY